MNVVYSILCEKSSKFYVGATTKFKARKAAHLRSLRRKKHHSIKLQRAWDKYGEQCFKFKILEEVIEIDDLPEREQFWIDKLDSYHSGYNGRKDVVPYYAYGQNNGMFGKEPPNKNIASKNRKPVVSYKIETGEVEHFDFVQEVSLKYPKIGPQFLACITKEKIEKNNLISCKGRFWFYLKDFCLDELIFRFIKYNKPHGYKLRGKKRPEKDRKAISKGKKGIKFSESHRKNISQSKIGKRVIGIKRSDGKIYSSVKEAAEDIGLATSSSLSHHLRGDTKTCKGWTFEYIEGD